VRPRPSRTRQVEADHYHLATSFANDHGDGRGVAYFLTALVNGGVADIKSRSVPETKLPRLNCLVRWYGSKRT
jgi:hypothetical protein